MSDALEKAKKLIALAVNEAASPAEAREAAIQAVRLIHKHKLLDGGVIEAPKKAPVGVEVEGTPVDPHSWTAKIRFARMGMEVGRPRRAGESCPKCRQKIEPNDFVIRGVGPHANGAEVHLRCAIRGGT